MKKTLFFHISDNYTGSTRVLEHIITEEYADQKVTVITRVNEEGPLSKLPNVHLVSIWYPKINNKRIRFFSYLISRISPYILAFYYGLSHNEFYINTITPYYAGIVGWILRKKIIYHVHEKFVRKTQKIKFAEFIFDHIPATRIYVSKYLRTCYKEREDCISIIKYNSLPKSFLSKVHIKPISDRKRNTVQMLCSLDKAKGIFTFISLSKRMPELRFRLIISTEKKLIYNFLANVEIPQNLELISRQTDIHPFLYDVDLNLNLSIPHLWIETFGMTILEAMAYGIPSIVPNVGGPIELIENGVNGFALDVTDIDLLVDKIQESLLKDKYEYLAANSLIKLKTFVKNENNFLKS